VVHRPDVRRIEPHRLGTSHVTFSPDGGRLVGVGRDDKVKVWDAQSGREILAFGDRENFASAVAFSRDGSRIATCGVDGWIQEFTNHKVRRRPTGFAIRVWDAQTGHELAKIEGKTGFDAVAFAADSGTLTTLDAQNRPQVWEVKESREIIKIEGTFVAGNRRTIVQRSVAFDSSARRVVLATVDIPQPAGDRRDAGLKLWDVDARDFRQIASATHAPFAYGGRDCLLSPDGSLIVTIAYNRTARQLTVALLDFETGALVRRAEPDPESYERLLAFSPDGRSFLTARQDGILRLWDVATGRIAATIQGPEGVDVPRQEKRTIDARAVAFLPKGVRIASGGLRGWNDVDAATGRIKPDPATGVVYHVEPLQVSCIGIGNIRPMEGR
jgi:WD40 repeat protein